MPPSIPRPTAHESLETLARRRALHSLFMRPLPILALLVSLGLAYAPATRAKASPQEPSPQTERTESSQSTSPQTTPHMRPRKVGVKPYDNPEDAANRQNESPAEEVDEDEVVRVDSNLVIIPASVVDNRGRAVTNLKVEDFELRVDGQLRPISDLSRAEMPVFITMLFDNSASLSVAREFEKQAAVRFFSSLVRPIDRAAIYSISTNPTLAQPLTNDVSRLIGTIERFGKPEGATALFDSIAQAADYMRSIPGRKVLVLVSDGTDTVSDISFEEAVTRTLRAECQVYVVQTRQVEDPTLGDPVSEQRMLKLAEQTGGAVHVPQTIDDLDAAFSQIALDLSQQYLLSYYPQEGRLDNYFRFINLRVKDRPQMRVRARKGFYPLAAQNDLPPPDAGIRSQSRAAREVAANDTPGGSSAREDQKGAAARPSSVQTPARPASNRNRAPTRRIGPTTAEDENRASDQASGTQEPTTTLTVTVAQAETSRKPHAPVASPSSANTPTSTVVLTSTPSPAPRHSPAETPNAMATNTDEKPPAEKIAAPDEEVDDGERVVSGGVLNSRALQLPLPLYPQHARSLGIGGTVVVEVTIDERGRVAEAKAVSGPKQLYVSAIDAARHARFSPTLLSGRPVRVKGTIRYNFVRP